MHEMYKHKGENALLFAKRKFYLCTLDVAHVTVTFSLALPTLSQRKQKVGKHYQTIFPPPPKIGRLTRLEFSGVMGL